MEGDAAKNRAFVLIINTRIFVPKPRFRAGQRCQVHGLKSTAGVLLNGAIATVMGVDGETDRLQLRFGDVDPPSAWKRIKPENLAAIAEDDEGESCCQSMNGLD